MRRQSIPATEHSVMTAWPSEEDAILNMIKHFGDGVFACVLDSYDYENWYHLALHTRLRLIVCVCVCVCCFFKKKNIVL